MIELKKEFKKYGFEYRQIEKLDDIVVYMAQGKSCDEKVTNSWFEIFRPTVKQPDKFFDEEYEAYPSSSSFGNWAWCCTTIGSIRKILKNEFGKELKELPNLHKGIAILGLTDESWSTIPPDKK